jgi:hypothetical protein
MRPLAHATRSWRRKRRALVVVGIVGAVGIGAAFVNAGTHHNKSARVSTSRTTTTATTAIAGLNAASPTTIPSATVPPPRPKSDVTLIVVNAGVLPVEGGALSNTLRRAGYSPLRPLGDDLDHPPKSVVVYAPGYQSDAASIGTVVSIGSIAPQSESPIPTSFTKGADVMVVIGSDLKA